MKNMLTPSHIADYNKDGFIFPLNVLTKKELAYFQSKWAQLKNALPPGRTLVRGPYMFLNFRWAYELATHPKILNAVSCLLGDDLIIGGGLILAKPADGNTFVSWHQDAHYATHLNGSEALTSWLALSTSNIQNGCMRVIPGTQNKNFEHVEIFDKNNMLSLGQTVKGVAAEQAIDLELAPGQSSLHHFNLLHSSNFNRSASIRTGFIVRYCTPKIIHEEGMILIHASGKMEYDHLNVITDIPNYSFEEGLKRQLASDQKLISEYMEQG